MILACALSQTSPLVVVMWQDVNNRHLPAAAYAHPHSLTPPYSYACNSSKSPSCAQNALSLFHLCMCVDCVVVSAAAFCVYMLCCSNCLCGCAVVVNEQYQLNQPVATQQTHEAAVVADIWALPQFLRPTYFDLHDVWCSRSFIMWAVHMFGC